ncbi:hypothetical protein [Mycoplasmoides alvi]|uniref:hypothetical protein n=1 Tax=Mycoplasmoides alvi TaxID=78580 RepID=UPI00051C7EDC|nr:hypothetical protein [Mycoplasmoides alvi]
MPKLQNKKPTIKNLSKTVKNLSTRVEDVSAIVENLSTRVEDLSKTVENLSTRVEDLSKIVENLSKTMENVIHLIVDMKRELKQDINRLDKRIDYYHKPRSIEKFEDLFLLKDVLALEVTKPRTLKWANQALNKISKLYPSKNYKKVWIYISKSIYENMYNLLIKADTTKLLTKAKWIKTYDFE